jgi:hypothetical protein
MTCVADKFLTEARKNLPCDKRLCLLGCDAVVIVHSSALSRRKGTIDLDVVSPKKKE